MANLSTIESRYQSCLRTLTFRSQAHVLRWWDDLGLAEREHLLGEIESIPWNMLDDLMQSHVLRKPDESILHDLAPPLVYEQEPEPGQRALYEEATVLGRELLRASKVAALTVAGGQGTRLGFEGPKGAITITPVREKTLFQLFAEMIRAVRKRYDAIIPWYIMTNPANHEQTLGFLKDHEFFGLPETDVVLFAQGMLPAFDFNGRMLLEDKHRLVLAPDGHGGSLKGLVSSGALEDMQKRSIKIISYFQVDNPLVKPFDPLFIGLHAKTESEMSTKVTPKVDDLERVGNVCVCDGRLCVIEYSNFPPELAKARNPDGSRKFRVGNLAIHLLELDFIDRIIGQCFQLPYRRAEKVATWMDDNGFLRTPQKANAVKLETFVFDAIPLARNPLLLEVDRSEEFSPVKNRRGVDSIESAIRDQIRRATRWLEGAGVTIPKTPEGTPDVTVEIAPSYALDPEDLGRRISQAPELLAGETIYIY